MFHVPQAMWFPAFAKQEQFLLIIHRATEQLCQPLLQLLPSFGVIILDGKTRVRESSDEEATLISIADSVLFMSLPELWPRQFQPELLGLDISIPGLSTELLGPYPLSIFQAMEPSSSMPEIFLIHPRGKLLCPLACERTAKRE